jgi:integrase
MMTLITVFNWAKKKGILKAVPTYPDLPPAYYEHIVPPSESEMQRLLEVSPEHLQRVIIIGARCGVRVGESELLKLRWEHVDFERGVLRVQAANKNKKEPWREVPIQKDILELFREWHKADQKSRNAFIIHYNEKDGIDSIQKGWEAAKKRAGITRKLPAYSLRHKFATDLLAAGADPGTVAKLMGHSSTDMIFAHYQHVMTKQKVQAIESLPTIGDKAVCVRHVHKAMCTTKNGQSLS